MIFLFKTFRLIYKSIPFGYDQNILNGILSDAINYNKKNNITGALVCRDDIYLVPIFRILLLFKSIFYWIINFSK